MKKYFFGILMIAVIAVVGGLKIFSGTNSAFAAAACLVNSNNVVITVNDGQCWGTHLCTNGVMGDPGSCLQGSTATGNTSNVATFLGGTSGVLTSTTPVLTWTPVSGAIAYNLQISDKSDFSSIVFEQKNVSGNSYRMEIPSKKQTNPNLAVNTKYYFRVQSVGNYGLMSDWSNTFSFTTGSNEATTIAGKPAIVPSGFVSDSQNFYSLLSSLGSWTNSSGQTVAPKQIKQELIYTDENGQRVYPKADTKELIDAVSRIWDSRSEISSKVWDSRSEIYSMVANPISTGGTQ